MTGETSLQQPDDPRIAVRRPGAPDPDGRVVVYWMQRAQRAADNPALDAAIAAANLLRKPVVVLFVLVPHYPSATREHYAFMLEGLRALPHALAGRGAGFVVRTGGPDEVGRFCHEAGAALVVGDENPLREPEAWRRTVAASLRVPFWTVDADVIVPSVLMEKEQYSAATMRPRVHRQLDWCLRPPSRRRAVVPPPPGGVGSLDRASAAFDAAVLDAAGRRPPRGGRTAALSVLRAFVKGPLCGYADQRNEPALDATSHLSPYLHFGQIGPREVALAVGESGAPLADRQAFLEEFVVRRELAVNFVRFNPAYDRLEGCEAWARATLDRHRRDERPWRYTERQLEEAATHDPLWNAAQRQMMDSGWMHGYVRMYWAKKILEWSRSPEEAFATAIALNDRYELDGRDPNGYAGIAWAIGGKHDRGWGPERPIFGTIRYMSLASTARKFDSRRYIERWTARTTTGSRREGHQRS